MAQTELLIFFSQTGFPAVNLVSVNGKSILPVSQAKNLSVIHDFSLSLFPTNRQMLSALHLKCIQSPTTSLHPSYLTSSGAPSSLVSWIIQEPPNSSACYSWSPRHGPLLIRVVLWMQRSGHVTNMHKTL